MKKKNEVNIDIDLGSVGGNQIKEKDEVKILTKTKSGRSTIGITNNTKERILDMRVNLIFHERKVKVTEDDIISRGLDLLEKHMLKEYGILLKADEKILPNSGRK